jgi:hypothetical protein
MHFLRTHMDDNHFRKKLGARWIGVSVSIQITTLMIGAALMIGAVTILWVLRRRKSNDLDSLGAVSQRWIADERASSRDGLR